MSYSYYSNRGGTGSPFVKILITVGFLALVSFGAAYFWHQSEDAMTVSASGNGSSSVNESAPSSSESSGDEEYRDIDMSDETLANVAAPSSEQSDTSEESEVPEESKDSQEDASSPSQYSREAIAGSVPPSKSVGFSYFNDAIFFGDSISVGIPLYMQTMVPNAAVIAAQGVSPGGALTSQCINSGGSRITMLEAARAKGERKKIYIMLGANALDYDEATFIKGYSEFLQAVKTEYPEAVIYIQSMLPVTANVNNVYSSKNINNDRIAAYNVSICKMALDAGVNYVDVAQAIVDENGMLPISASPSDGMHLSAEYYMKWFDYLRSHTVSPKK